MMKLNRALRVLKPLLCDVCANPESREAITVLRPGLTADERAYAEDAFRSVRQECSPLYQSALAQARRLGVLTSTEAEAVVDAQLLRAVQSFDRHKGASFKTYAAGKINHAINHEAQGERAAWDGLTGRERRDLDRMESLRSQGSPNDPFSEESFADMAGIARRRVRRLGQREAQRPLRMDMRVADRDGENTSCSLGDLITRPTDDPCAQLIAKEEQALLTQEVEHALKSLPVKQRRAIEHRYMQEGKPATFKEVGQALKCSDRAAASQCQKAREALESALRACGLQGWPLTEEALCSLAA